jgi:hypothetical protein
MFLPVLLVRDYGIGGWIVFAIPNVIGAAAMGWFVRDAEASRRLVKAHATAGAIFSIVTVVFQVFFGAWYFSRMFGSKGGANPLGVLCVVPTAVVFAASLLMEPRDVKGRTAMTLAMLCWIVSMVCLITFVIAHGISIPIAPEDPHRGLSALAAVCVLGFALCPYLDLTFHEARQQTSQQGGRVAFGIGFGILFTLMIVFTLLYARAVLSTIALTAVATHILLQLAFTIAIHLEQLHRVSRPVLVVACIGMLMALPLGYFTGEMIYRLFMGCYGLLFPAYVWLCMIPTWRNPAKPSPRSLTVFAGSVVVAAPFYWVGFIVGNMPWAIPGVAIVLLSRLALAEVQTPVPPEAVGA